ncbi:MAG: hypothetical protein NZ108_08115, partial [Bacteroidia bacterium]|nr:hypothetical protein [Bacteroidia bacterium]
MPKRFFLFAVLSIFGVILLISLLNLSDNETSLWKKRLEEIRKQTDMFLQTDINSPLPDSLKHS